MEKNQKIKLADVECIDNRKMEGIEELAANIAAVGLLQPVILTPAAETGKYRVVDGRRRFRALEHLKREALEFYQYVIWTGDQYQETEAAFCANFARQNLTLAEEVDALRNIADTNEGVAKLLGKTPAWVALRRNLANLTGQWAEVLHHPEDYPQWTAAKLELIARETPEVQESLEYLVDDDDNVTLRDLREMLDGDHRLLKTANFNTACCKECPKRSGAQGLLFADLDDGLDCCLDFECYRKKSLDAIKALLKAQPHFIPIMGERGDYGSEEYRYACDIDAKHSYDFEVLREPDVGDRANAVVVFGKDMGKLMFAIPRRRPEAAAARSAAAPGEKHEKSVAEREAELIAKRTKLALQKLNEWLHNEDNNNVVAWMARGGYDDKKALLSCLKLVWYFGCIGEFDSEWRWKKPDFKAYTDRDFVASAFEHANTHFAKAVNEEIGRTLAEIQAGVGKDVCGLLFLDWSEFMKAAEAEIPEPKSLQVARIKEQQAARKAQGGAEK